jgi:formylglycine-generating enzyme required for sulfatase activity
MMNLHITLSVILISCNTLLALDAPQISIQSNVSTDSTHSQLSWTPVADADRYRVFGRTDYFASDTLYKITTATTADISLPLGWGAQTPNKVGFFSVKADSFGNVAGDTTFVPAGDFIMGMDGYGSPEHPVSFTQDFYIGTALVTNEEYRATLQWAYDNGYVDIISGEAWAYGFALLDLTGPGSEISFDGFSFNLDPVSYGDYAGENSANHPVKKVSWFGAVCYCDWRVKLMD